MKGQRMDPNSQIVLKTDRAFAALIFPLKREDYLKLKENILTTGCKNPIITWNGYIVDGHKRYRICMENEIPFETEQMEFSCREEAIAWICVQQLGRKDISEETHRFLIGKQYEAEKQMYLRDIPKGSNQFLHGDSVGSGTMVISPGDRIARENNIARSTVEKYAVYAKALDDLKTKDPDIAAKILSGQYKVAHKNVVALSKLTPAEIKKVERAIQKMQEPFIQFNKFRTVLSTAPASTSEDDAISSVKDMPAFDPDADITGLTLTIPSWTSSINRVLTKTDLSIVSDTARNSLANELQSLLKNIDKMLSAIEED